jgi:predicted nucleic acid-binding protein
MYFVDTNVFLRVLTKDDRERAEKCFALLKKAEAKEIELTTTEAVITEIVYILASKKWFNLARERIHELLSPVLRTKGLYIPKKHVYFRALDLYAQYKLDFEDCIIVAHMDEQHIQELYSYDAGIDAISSVQRVEPSI